MTSLRVDDFGFDLPAELIAQEPPPERGQSRMLAMDRASGAVRDSEFAEFPSLLEPGDLLVLNDTRVISARLYAGRTLLRDHEKPTGRIEVLLTEPAGENLWRALVRPGRKVAIGEILVFAASNGAIALQAEVLERGGFGDRLLRFAPVDDFFAVLDSIGHMPLPPYIRRNDQAEDRQRYQTVFAWGERGSVAAPTAGLHFTQDTLAELAARGVEIARVTLNVGLGTFAPLRVETLDEVRLHRERYTLPADTADAVNRAVREGRRIVAVGTTVVRTLEHCALKAVGDLKPHSGATEIFISPGFKFRLVGGLLTNFHLPQSSLLMLVSAFAGREQVLAAYRHAVQQTYRFFSYGDCMFLA